MQRTAVHAATRELFRRWKNSPKPVVVQNVSELPDSIRSKAEAEEAAGKRVRGAYDPKTDTVYLVADGLHNGHEAAFVTIHEVVGHRGIESIVPDVTAFYERLAREKGLQDAAEAREWLADKAAEWKTEPWWRKLIAMVRKALARMMPGRAWADAEIRMLVDAAGKYAETGAVSDESRARVARMAGEGEGGQGEIAFSTTTDADIPATPLASLRENMREAVDVLMRQRWFPEMLRREILNQRAVTDLTDTNAKPDLSAADLLLRTISHYSEKVPQLRKIYEAAMRIADDKHGFREIIFGDDHALLRTVNEYFTQTGKDIRGALDSEKRKQTAARLEEAKRLGEYLFQRDRDAIGYRVVKKNGQWSVQKPVMEDGLLKHKQVGTSDTETGGWDMAIEFEADELRAQGYSEAAIAAFKAVRQITNNMYGIIAGEASDAVRNLRGLGKYGDAKLVIQAMNEFGDRRGYYMPRMRKPGQYILKAYKDGEKILEKFDIDGSPLFYGSRRWKAAQLKRQGYKVEFSQDENPSEESLFAAKLVSINDQFRNMLSHMKDDAGKTLADFNLNGKWETTADGKREYVIEGDVRSEIKAIMMTMGGHRYPRQGETKKVWHFVEPVDGFEKRLVSMLTRQAMAQSFAKTAATQLADAIKAHGSRSVKIRRSEAVGEDVWRGYEEDVSRALALAGSSLAGGSAKRKFAQSSMRAITGMEETWNEYYTRNFPKDLKKNSDEGRAESQRLYKEYDDMVEKNRLDSGLQPVAFKEAGEYIQDMLRNDSQMERIIGKIRGIAALKYLSGVSSSLINVSSMVTVVPAALKAYGNMRLDTSVRMIGRASLDYKNYIIARKTGRPVTGDTAALFDEIRKRGWDTPLMNMEAMNSLETWSGRGARRAMDLMMWAFSATEQFNRATTIAAAYYGLMEQKYGDQWKSRGIDETVMSKAKSISDKAHAVYGKANLPAWMRGPGVGPQALRSWYMFKNYSHNWAQIMYEMGVQKGDMQAVAYMMFAPMLLAGAGASGAPREWAVKALRTILRALGFDMPDDPEMAMYDAIGENYGDYARQVAQGGVMGALGVNIQASLRSDRMVPTNLSELLGAPASVVLDATQGAGAAWNGEWLKAAEKISPRIVAGGFRGWREATDGVTTPSGKPVFWGDEPLRATPFQFMVRLPGFNPIGLSMKTDQQWNERKTAAQYDEEKSDLYARLRSMLRAGKVSKAKYAAWLQDVEAWNAQVRTRRPAGVTQITDQSIWFVAKDMKTPPKGERDRGSGVQAKEERLGVTMEELLRGKAKKK